MQDIDMIELKQRFEDYLASNLPVSDTFHPYFKDALDEMLKAGGKRFRPMLLLCVVGAYDRLLLKNSMSVALALEFLHTYSLIHDDLPAMDDSDFRRGHPTLHKTYDEVTAILVGDALNTHSFNLIANASFDDSVKIELIKSLSSDGGIDGMIIGQAIDCFFENKPLDVEQIEFLHIHKTAKLIATSLKMGAIITNKTKDIQDELYHFGIDLGLLFQIQDDIIDEIGDEDIEGKPMNNDENKNSFINLLGLDKSIQEADKLADKLSVQIDNFEEKLSINFRNLLGSYLYRHSI
jgi:farnesyl diphosphate synthase